jgi:hypothetical protein
VLAFVLEAIGHVDEVAGVELVVGVFVAAAHTERTGRAERHDGLRPEGRIAVPVASGGAVAVRLEGEHREAHTGRRLERRHQATGSGM